MKKLYSVLFAILFTMSIFAQVTTNYLQIDGGVIVAGGHYSVPVNFSGYNISGIEATQKGYNLYFNLQDENSVSVNEWPYWNSYPQVSFDPYTQNNELRWGLFNSERFSGRFNPVKIKFYSNPNNTEITSAFMGFSSVKFVDGNYNEYYQNTFSLAAFTVYRSNDGTFGGTDDGLLETIKTLDIATGKIGVDIKTLAFRDLDGNLIVDSYDAYLRFLKHFNRINQYPVETGYDYYGGGNGNIIPSGEIIAQQLNNKIMLTIPENITNGDISLKLPTGAWIEKMNNVSNSISEKSGTSKISFINNNSVKSVIIIHGVKNLSEINVTGSINNGIPIVVTQSTATAVEKTSVPTEFKLEQNYPNPFNPTTTISYQLPEAGNVSLKVYDIAGREVAELINEQKIAGLYEAKFDASGLASGIYMYKLTCGSLAQVKKMLLMK